MPIPVHCSNCGSKFKAPSKAAGRSTSCPKCNCTLTIPTERSKQSPNSGELVNVPSFEVGAAVAEPPSVATKECPYCSEEILLKAVKCKHCGEIVDAALRAAEEAKQFAFQTIGSGGSSSSAAASTTVVVNSGRGFPHFLHLILTIFTCGFWFPIWVLHYIFRSR